MLALYHLANSPNPETLPGLAEIFAEAGIAKLPNRPKPPLVFVGTAMGAYQPIAVEGARTVRSLWGLIAVKLGGWKAYDAIQTSDEARTNPGSAVLIPILREAAPCLILLDEVVAYARNLQGVPYDGFVSFMQSLTEPAPCASRCRDDRVADGSNSGLTIPEAPTLRAHRTAGFGVPRRRPPTGRRQSGGRFGLARSANRSQAGP